MVLGSPRIAVRYERSAGRPLRGSARSAALGVVDRLIRARSAASVEDERSEMRFDLVRGECDDALHLVFGCPGAWLYSGAVYLTRHQRARPRECGRSN